MVRSRREPDAIEQLWEGLNDSTMDHAGPDEETEILPVTRASHEEKPTPKPGQAATPSPRPTPMEPRPVQQKVLPIAGQPAKPKLRDEYAPVSLKDSFTREDATYTGAISLFIAFTIGVATRFTHPIAIIVFALFLLLGVILLGLVIYGYQFQTVTTIAKAYGVRVIQAKNTQIRFAVPGKPLTHDALLMVRGHEAWLADMDGKKLLSRSDIHRMSAK